MSTPKEKINSCEFTQYFNNCIYDRLLKLNILPDYHSSILATDLTDIICNAFGGFTFYFSCDGKNIKTTYIKEWEILEGLFNDYLMQTEYLNEHKEKIINEILSIFKYNFSSCLVYIPKNKKNKALEKRLLILNDSKFLMPKELARKYNLSLQSIYSIIRNRKKTLTLSKEFK